jgi:hypothetical protein
MSLIAVSPGPGPSEALEIQERLLASLVKCLDQPNITAS